MKYLLVLMTTSALLACQPSANRVTELKTEKERISYSIGLNLGSHVLRDSIEIDYAALEQGFKDASLDTVQRLIKPAELAQVMLTLQRDIQAKQNAKRAGAAEKNRREGERFLAENAKEAGVVTLPSGLQYKVLKEGNGPRPKPDQTVTAHYVGTLISGEEFDSSHKRGEPAQFPVTGVIQGWTEVLQLMKVGSTWRVFIPSHLAYGDQGAGEMIQPGSLLIFEIELLGVK